MTNFTDTRLPPYLKFPEFASIMYYAIRFAPETQQFLLTVLYTLNEEISEVRQVSDPNLAKVKLQWWRHEIEKLYEKKAEHPVVQALYPYLSVLPKEHLEKIIDLYEMDLNQNRYQDFTELGEYLGLYGQSYFICLAYVSGLLHHASSHADHLLIASIGEAALLTEKLHKMGQDIAKGYIYLPIDMLKEKQLKPAQLLHYEQSPEIQAICETLATTLKNTLTTGIKELKKFPKDKRCFIRYIARASLFTLKKLEQDHWQVLKHQVTLSPMKLLWMAWKNSHF
ncbi:squalene/phytoene synthase family protein [Basilea psittacipulmonis]|uniref:squalene/phytoene synthase family protein n=1 Tax=Basilea psittacipulmonis TaxID=1472345 RepID=UPI0006909BF2|nr:squalene/phytoene synthase family protein [Basilea psittacipulmonis]